METWKIRTACVLISTLCLPWHTYCPRYLAKVKTTNNVYDNIWITHFLFQEHWCILYTVNKQRVEYILYISLFIQYIYQHHNLQIQRQLVCWCFLSEPLRRDSLFVWFCHFCCKIRPFCIDFESWRKNSTVKTWTEKLILYSLFCCWSIMHFQL